MFDTPKKLDFIDLERLKIIRIFIRHSTWMFKENFERCNEPKKEKVLKLSNPLSVHWNMLQCNRDYGENRETDTR